MRRLIKREPSRWTNIASACHRRAYRQHRSRWTTAVLKPMAIEPELRDKKSVATSRAAFRTAGLHFHDVRRECGSRWLEGGVPLHVVRDWLGLLYRADITYLRAPFRASTSDESLRGALCNACTKPKTAGQTGPQTATPGMKRPMRMRGRPRTASCNIALGAGCRGSNPVAPTTPLFPGSFAI